MTTSAKYCWQSSIRRTCFPGGKTQKKKNNKSVCAAYVLYTSGTMHAFSIINIPSFNLQGLTRKKFFFALPSGGRPVVFCLPSGGVFLPCCPEAARWQKKAQFVETLCAQVVAAFSVGPSSCHALSHQAHRLRLHVSLRPEATAVLIGRWHMYM